MIIKICPLNMNLTTIQHNQAVQMEITTEVYYYDILFFNSLY